MLVARANALAHGASGVRASLVDRLLDVLAQGFVPHVPAKGSVGAAGALLWPMRHGWSSGSAAPLRVSLADRSARWVTTGPYSMPPKRKHCRC